MNIPYLAQTLGTDKLSEVVANIDALPLDMNLAIWDSIDAGEIEVNEEEGTIKILKDVVPSSDPELSAKILRTIQHYAKNETNITRGRLNALVKDPVTKIGYDWAEYILAVQHLIDQGTVVEDDISVPAHSEKKTTNKGKIREKIIRPAHRFVFLGLPGNDNPEWNAKAVNKWIEDFDKVK